MININNPEYSITSRQPMVCTPIVMRGNRTAPPEEKPVIQIDIAIALRLINHRFTALSKVCPSPALLPVETIPTKIMTNTQ